MYLNVLPDPNYKIDAAGVENASGVAGPGFSTVAMTFSLGYVKETTIDGKTILHSSTRPSWDININYNPLTFPEFSPVYNFLMEKRGSRKSFYASLPQYKAPKDPLFATYVPGNTITAFGAGTIGERNILITTSAWSVNDYSVSGLPKAGDVFTITDPNDSLHSQVYMVSHVDTYDTYVVLPSSQSIRIHFFPGLQRNVSNGSTINFNNPLFKVRQKQDIQEYSLDTENLYSFNIKLEEALQ